MSVLWIVLLLPILGGAERFNCRGRILGAYYADAKSGCKAFHVCVKVAGGGVRDFRFFCPPGTLFHQEAQTCTDWGDDDPLACPADIYDGQFDLYKIGSAYDTKKLSSSGNRDDESEYGLQRAETGDRRLSQNNAGASDLRTAHSSDFFSGQRDRDRDESARQTQSPVSAANVRQPYKRPTTTPQPTTYPTTQYTTPAPTFPPQTSQYYQTKRKSIRKRPISVSTIAPSTATNTFQTQSYSEQSKPDFTRKQNFAEQNKQDFARKQQTYTEQKNRDYNRQQQSYTEPPKQDFNRQSQSYTEAPRQDYNRQQQSYTEQPKQDSNRQQQFYAAQQKNGGNRPQQINSEQQKQSVNRQPSSVGNNQIPPNVNLPAQYQDEYVEVTRVSPKNNNRFYPNSPSPNPYFTPTKAPTADDQKGLVELYNYEAQSTPSTKSQNENKFKVKNSFNVAPSSSNDFTRSRNKNYNNNKEISSPSVDYNSLRGTSTPSYINFNSVSYEPEKNNFVDFPGNKQNYFNSPTTTPTTTTIYTTTRLEPFLNVNTIAYNTNIGFDAQSVTYSESGEDDGQYRPPQGEDDGQYRPELYERESELLSGAHSLNIAASNRLPEEHKQNKNKLEKTLSKPAETRPFRPVPTPFTTSTTKAPETYPTTQKTVPDHTTPRNFDYYKTYTTTSRPYDIPAVQDNNFVSVSSPSLVSKINTETTPRYTNRPSSRETYSTSIPTHVQQPTKSPKHANLPNKKEDSNYDYAYYDSDPGFSEYDQIEEFRRTSSKL